MNLAALLEELRRRDIWLSIDDDRLRCDAPAGALTPQLREHLRLRKADLLEFLRTAETIAQQPEAIVPMQPSGTHIPVYALGGHLGDVFAFRDLVRHLGDKQPFFGLQPPGADGHGEPFKRVEDLAAYFASLNRDKQSIILDLKNPQGAAILSSLLETADVFVTNMRAAALERLGLHPQALEQRYPRLVIASISGFGMENSGEFSDRAGLAMVAEAMAGATGLTRDHSGNPVWCVHADVSL